MPRKAISTSWCPRVVHLGFKKGILELVLHRTHNTSSKQAAIGDLEMFVMTPRLRTSIQVPQNDRGANVHKHKQVSCGIEPSSPFYGQFCVQNGCFWAVFKSFIMRTKEHRCFAW